MPVCYLGMFFCKLIPGCRDVSRPNNQNHSASIDYKYKIASAMWCGGYKSWLNIHFAKIERMTYKNWNLVVELSWAGPHRCFFHILKTILISNSLPMVLKTMQNNFMSTGQQARLGLHEITCITIFLVTGKSDT